MKRKTFYHLSLSLPYVLLLISGAFTYYVEGLDFFSSPSQPGAVGVFLGILAFFTLSAILWAPLYTWLVVVMLFWGRGKPADEVRKMYLLSPTLLAAAMGFPALLVSMPGSGLMMLWALLHLHNMDFIMPVFFDDYSVEQSLSVVVVWAFMAVLCLVIGYAFVGCVLLIERTMKRRGLLVGEEPADEILPGS